MNDHLFSGLKVIDCASWIAGPAAATILSDFGADVIKIEPPGAGDPWRARSANPHAHADSYWQLTSRNKRSLALDLKHKAGRDGTVPAGGRGRCFRHEFSAARAHRLKLEPADLLPLSPRLIYASFTAYGEVGEEAAKTGFDSTAYWARTGLMDAVRADVDTVPARSAPGMGDHPSATGLYAAIVTALYRREKTGKGGVVSSSLLANGLWANGCFVQTRLVRRTDAAPSAARASAECAGQPLPLPRRPLVHHGAVQRGTAVAAVPRGDRARGTGGRSALRDQAGAAARMPPRWWRNSTRCSRRATCRSGGEFWTRWASRSAWWARWTTRPMIRRCARSAQLVPFADGERTDGVEPVPS